MSNIFTTNSQAERFMGAQQRTAVRPDDFGARRLEKDAAVAGGSSNAEFFKTRADARELAMAPERVGPERAGDNDSVRSSAITDSPEAASDSSRSDAGRRADAAADAPVESIANSSADPSKRSTKRPERADENPVQAYDRSSVGSQRPGTTRVAGESRLDNNIEGNSGGGGGSAPGVEGAGYIEKAIDPNGSLQSGGNLLEVAKATQPGGSESGFLKAYQVQNGTAKKAGVSQGKAAGAYEAAAVVLDNKDSAVPGDTFSGELPKLVNAKAGAYTPDSAEEGSKTVVGEDAAVGEGVASTDAGEEATGIIIKGDPVDLGVFGEADTGVLEGKAGEVRSEKSGTVDGDGKGAQEAGRETVAAAAAGGVALKVPYAQGRTDEKGAGTSAGKEDGAQQATKKASASSSEKTAPQRVAPPGGEQADIPVEEPEPDTGEAADGVKLVEGAAGKEQKVVSPGFTKDNHSGASKPDMAAMKNDGKVEGMVQAKNANTGVEAAKKATATPKTLSNFGKLQEGVFNAVDRGVRLSLASGGQDAKLTLRPESLGELRIKLSIGADGQVQSKIMVDNAAVKSMLDNDAARLRGIFNGQGLNLESFSVEVGSGWSGQSARGEGSGFDLNGRGAQRAYGNGGGAPELDTFVMAEGVYGAAGSGLDLFA